MTDKTTRLFMYGKIHRCTVTAADLNYVGSVTIDPDLLVASGILPYTQVDVLNVSRDARLTTYVIPGTKGAGEICLNGPASFRFNAGDLAIIMAYESVPTTELIGRPSKTVLVDDNNKIKEIITYTVPSFDALNAGEIPSRAHEHFNK